MDNVLAVTPEAAASIIVVGRAREPWHVSSAEAERQGVRQLVRQARQRCLRLPRAICRTTPARGAARVLCRVHIPPRSSLDYVTNG